MSALFEAMNKTATTDNGCLAYHTSLSANLDFFYLAGASRGKNIKLEFKKALAENPEIALRTLQWLRDIRVEQENVNSSVSCLKSIAKVHK